MKFNRKISLLYQLQDIIDLLDENQVRDLLDEILKNAKSHSAELGDFYSTLYYLLEGRRKF